DDEQDEQPVRLVEPRIEEDGQRAPARAGESVNDDQGPTPRRDDGRTGRGEGEAPDDEKCRRREETDDAQPEEQALSRGRAPENEDDRRDRQRPRDEAGWGLAHEVPDALCFEVLLVLHGAPHVLSSGQPY